MGKFKDLTGQRFGRLVVVERTENVRDHTAWLCQCDCGNIVRVESINLAKGHTRSCGCLRRDLASIRVLESVLGEPEKGTRLRTIKPHKHLNKHNKTGVTGVFFDELHHRWRATMTFKGKQFYLGHFTTKQDAINARKAAEEKYFKPILEKYKEDSNVSSN